MKQEIIQSAGGIVYYIEENIPKFLIIKRQAKTKKIEWVAPKGKIKENEDPKDAALREVSEEAGLPINFLTIQAKVGVLELRQENKTGNNKNSFEKDIQYFLMKYSGDTNLVKILDGEGYTGQYKWATIDEINKLIYFLNMRILFNQAYKMVKEKLKKNSIKELFLNKIL